MRALLSAAEIRVKLCSSSGVRTLLKMRFWAEMKEGREVVEKREPGWKINEVRRQYVGFDIRRIMMDSSGLIRDTHEVMGMYERMTFNGPTSWQSVCQGANLCLV